MTHVLHKDRVSSSPVILARWAAHFTSSDANRPRAIGPSGSTIFFRMSLLSTDALRGSDSWVNLRPSQRQDNTVEDLSLTPTGCLFINGVLRRFWLWSKWGYGHIYFRESSPAWVLGLWFWRPFDALVLFYQCVYYLSGVWWRYVRVNDQRTYIHHAPFVASIRSCLHVCSWEALAQGLSESRA